MRDVAHIAHFQRGIRSHLMLHAQVVLIRDRRFQMRVHEVNGSRRY